MYISIYMRTVLRVLKHIDFYWTATILKILIGSLLIFTADIKPY